MTTKVERYNHREKGLFGFMALPKTTPADLRGRMRDWAEASVPEVIRDAFSSGIVTGTVRTVGASKIGQEGLGRLTDWAREIADGLDFTFEIKGEVINIYLISTKGDLMAISEDGE